MPSQPKGKKGRKATKEQRARQTRKAREARQARRDRKNQQDHDARGVTSPADTSFHRFPDLPLELREMIWDKCIPSRLVFHGLPGLYRTVHFEVRALRNQRRPPIISGVCNEARRFAFRHASRITIGTWYSELDRSVSRLSEETAWFDTKRDTLLLCQTRYSRPSFHLHTPTIQNPCWLEISNDGVASAKASGRLACLGPYPKFSRIQPATSDIFGTEWLRGVDVGYVVERYLIAAPSSAIMESGLFGLWGENRAIAVDVDDTDTFRALINLHRRYGREKRLEWCDARNFEEGQVWDIDVLDESTMEEISEHGRAWWLNPNGRFNADTEQFLEETPEIRLLALIFATVVD